MIHESVNAERLARGWHLVWAIACFATFANVTAALCMIPAAGLVFRSLECMLIGQLVLSGGGVLWHLFGAWQHQAAIQKMNNRWWEQYEKLPPCNKVAVGTAETNEFYRPERWGRYEGSQWLPHSMDTANG